MEEFEHLLKQVYPALERFVKFRLNGCPDAEDLLQDICLTACLKYHQLNQKEAFRPWILSIARNRCNDYFRREKPKQEFSLEAIPAEKLVYGRRGPVTVSPVEETMDLLTEKDRQILRLHYWQRMELTQIAQHLGIPVGTVKSRLHMARQHFQAQYPWKPKENKGKGESNMTKLPKIMPQYKMEPMEEMPFETRWEELQGWLIVPRVGDKLSWGMYEGIDGRRTEYTDIETIGKAMVHGIEGVEIVAVQYGVADYYRTGCVDKMERRFIAQLTDTHSRYLATSFVEDGIRKTYTFLDGEEFTDNWGFGEDNCGNEIHLKPKGLLYREGNTVTGHTPKEVVDVVGRYKVTIGERCFDTVCVMDIQCFNDGVASEQYINQEGRTVLWRRFNHDLWAIEQFGGKPWSQQLPGNERLIINGEVYVHWYDCLPDYVL